MPELPDVDLYARRIADRFRGQAVAAVRLASPFVLRTVSPPLSAAVGRRLLATRRLGKRVVLELEGSLFFVIHLMVSGRFRLADRGAKIPGKVGLLAIDFDDGALVLTEASPKKRASLHLAAGPAELAALDPGGLEVLSADVGAFGARLRAENRTLKRALTDPRLFSGIGNAYSDEILHAAGLSPVTRTASLEPADVRRLFGAVRETLVGWSERLAAESPGFPEKVTAFRDDFAVHGKYGKPCPRCGTPVQRIRYADNESNYCPTCQTGGKLLADRSLSRLLRGDWPKTLEELEARKSGFVGASEAPAPKAAAPKAAAPKAAASPRAEAAAPKAAAPRGEAAAPKAAPPRAEAAAAPPRATKGSARAASPTSGSRSRSR